MASPQSTEFDGSPNEQLSPIYCFGGSTPLLRYSCLILAMIATIALSTTPPELAAQKKKTEPELPFPPKLPDGKTLVTDTSADFLKPGPGLLDGVQIAKKPPTIDTIYFPGQDYKGNPWSAWGDSTFANGKYYTSFGDHLAPAGNGFIYEYDPVKKAFRKLVDVRKLLDLPEGHYTPGKVHTQLTMGEDGKLYFATHRGSVRVTTDAYHYKGDWILSVDPASKKAEIIAQGPVPKHAIPTGFLDPKRLIFYAGTAPGNSDSEGIRFFAYDVKNRKLLCAVEDGPSRALIFARSTGRVYYMQAKGGALMRYDPAKGGDPEKIPGEIGLRAASDESKEGIVYTVAHAQKAGDATLYAFNTKTEKIEKLGPLQVASSTYITALKLDPTGRYLYYIPGAHGGADKDGTPVVQYDIQKKSRKVIAFLHPYYKEKYGCALVGTYSYALSDTGDSLYVTWNANRGGRVWDVCALTVIQIPADERK